MIQGAVNARHEAVVRLRVRGPGGAESDVDAIVDSGFTSSLTLPATMVTALTLARQSGGTAMLAEGASVGTTFVNISGRGFWMLDSVLELWLRLLALHVDDPVESGTVATKIRDQWLLASRGIFTGCVPDGLEEAGSTEEGLALVQAAIHSLLQALEEAPGHLNKDVFNLMGFSNGTFTRDLETWRLVEVGNAFLALLDGNITAGPSDSSFMPGCQ